MEAVVRPAGKRDIAPILALYQQLELSPDKARGGRNTTSIDYQNGLSRMLGTPGLELLVLEQAGAVIGTMTLLIVPSLAHGGRPWAIIEQLIIAEDYRNQKMGRKMVEHAIDRARQAGCYKISVDSDKRRSGAHLFYRKLGFSNAAFNFRRYF